MTPRFTGKVVLVTGAGHGIGLAIAQRFAAEGASVAVNDSSEDRAREAAATIPQALPLAADVSNKAQVDAMFDALLARFGTIDVLVNNAGDIYAARHFLEGDEAWWDHVLGVNLKGAFLCSLRAAHVMARKGSGNIIHMSSGGATRAHRGNVAYDASKGGIEAMTRAMALDLAPYNVRVNAIVPGLIRTYDIDDALAAERGQVVPMGRLGDAEGTCRPHRVSCERRCPLHDRHVSDSGWRSVGAATLHAARYVSAQPFSAIREIRADRLSARALRHPLRASRDARCLAASGFAHGLRVDIDVLPRIANQAHAAQAIHLEGHDLARCSHKFRDSVVRERCHARRAFRRRVSQIAGQLQQEPA